MSSAAVPVVTGIGHWADRYDALILDLWGVIHNGLAAYPAVPDCLTHMRAAGMQILFLSNAPRRSKEVVKRLTELGIPPDAYDHIVTSGDLVREALSTRDDPFYAALGRDYYRLGPERDWGLMEDMDYHAAAFEDASFVVNTGLFEDDTETVADYEAFVVAALGRTLPMVCVNPDHWVMRGERLLPCAGALAEVYERRGGPTSYRGKPYAAAYDACFNAFGDIKRDRVLAIGDSLRTDIAGAQAAGIDAVFVTSGIHAASLGAESGGLKAACAEAGAHPIAAMTHLAW
jgi:HAD superfamily hydrolase (TIGR01459 family)